MIPKHYSLEVPERCLRLIDELWTPVNRVKVPGEEYAGPLTTTFLLALAGPIINMPLERIQKQTSTTDGYANDTGVNQALSDAFDKAFKLPMSKATFFEQGEWSYVKWSDTSLNLANALPDLLCAQLSANQAFKAAADMDLKQWASIIRNALAHGGVVYLDADGFSTGDNNASVLCFVSGKYDEKTRALLHLNCLRISEIKFRSFLRLWVAWMTASSKGERFDGTLTFGQAGRHSPRPTTKTLTKIKAG